MSTAAMCWSCTLHVWIVPDRKRSSADTPGAFAHARSKDPKHDHVVFHLETVDSGRARIVYNDPRRFGFMDLIARPVLADHPFFRELGLEPLGNDLGGETLARLFNGRKTPLKAALLNQKLIAGLGNIYVCEALWRTGSARNGLPARW